MDGDWLMFPQERGIYDYMLYSKRGRLIARFKMKNKSAFIWVGGK